MEANLQTAACVCMARYVKVFAAVICYGLHCHIEKQDRVRRRVKTAVTLSHLYAAVKQRQLAFMLTSGFGGLEVACWPLVPKFAGSNPGRSRRIFKSK